jgi:NTP pyrophosphatase (non-canonical NTP hydrolase)
MILQAMITQCTSDSARWFPGAQDLGFTTLAMCGEAGEVANLVKKIVRGSITFEDVYLELPEEIIDVLIYLCNLMGLPEFKDTNWKEIWDAKRRFNEERFA